MDLEDQSSASLARRAVEIPSPDTDALRIVALVRDNGRVVGYQLENKKIINKEQAINLARNGGIQGVGIANRKGSEYLKSLPDSTEDNNLGNLPSISKNQINNH